MRHFFVDSVLTSTGNYGLPFNLQYIIWNCHNRIFWWFFSKYWCYQILNISIRFTSFIIHVSRISDVLHLAWRFARKFCRRQRKSDDEREPIEIEIHEKWTSSCHKQFHRVYPQSTQGRLRKLYHNLKNLLHTLVFKQIINNIGQNVGSL